MSIAAVNSSAQTADIEIGAVELKDGATDTRAKVGAGNGLATTDPAVAVADPNALAELVLILAKEEAVRLLLANAATAAKQDTGNTSLASIDGKVTAVNTGAVVVASSALPAGAATGAKQDSLATLVGEVQATPTANTMLGRLKDLLSLIILAAGENHVGAVGGHIATTSTAASFTRPTDTNVYASGDLVANNTVANAVAPMSFTVARVAAGSGMIRRARLRKSGTGITNAQFRLHLYTTSPTQAGAGGANTGDNAVWSTDQAATYLGAIDVTVDKAFTDGAAGNGAPLIGSEINFALASGQVIYGLTEARGAYTPGNAEVYTWTLEVVQN